MALGSRFLLLGLLLLLARSVTAQQLWYQHYEHALELEGEKKWSAALAEVKRAAQRRPEPEARVRIYGSRFLFNYDPAYHQALCLVELKRWEEAREPLARAREAGVTTAEKLNLLLQRIERGPPSTDDEPAESVVTHSLLRVESTPVGARVLVDGRAVGQTPLNSVEIEVGPHRVEVEAEGFDGWRQRIEAQEGKLLHLAVALRKTASQELPPKSDSSPRRDNPPAEDDPLVSLTVESITLAPVPSISVLDPDRVNPDEGVSEELPPAPREPTETREASPGSPLGSRTEESRSIPSDSALQSSLASEEQPPRPPWRFLATGMGVVALVWFTFHRSRSRGRRMGKGAIASLAKPPKFDSPSWLVDGTLGGYRLLEILGRGGMATTYLAERLADGKEVALKVPHDTGDPSFHSRFIREGRLGQTLHHPRLVRIFEAGEESGKAFLAMERIPGQTLRAQIDAGPATLPVRRVLEIVGEIAEGLDYAHSKGVVHRDLKPENIMLKPDGSLKVMDFGIARFDDQPGLTAAGYLFGSPLYAAPEQVQEGKSDHRADLYSLGVLFFELLEGKPPFVSESVFRILEMHRDEPLPDPAALTFPPPPEVWQVVARLLAKKPADRFATAQELLVALKGLLFQMEEPFELEGKSYQDSGIPA